MTEEEKAALGKRLLAVPGFELVPGMRDLERNVFLSYEDCHEVLVASYGEIESIPQSEFIPDLTHRPTLGCLLIMSAETDIHKESVTALIEILEAHS